MALALLWLQLGAMAAVILVAAQFLTRSADAVALKTGLGRSFAGVVMLATATSLPEVGTGISAIVLVDAPDLAAGDAFGSNLVNLMIIGLADLYWRNGPVLTAVGLTAAVVAAFGAGMIALAVMAIYFHHATSVASSWYLSPASILMLVGFLVAMLVIYRREQGTDSPGESEGEARHGYADKSLRRVLGVYVASAAAVVASAVWLATVGEHIAEEMGWEASFVGTQFLALSTSLPEVATVFAALRLHAPSLAITNALGSNVFNMGFVLFADDLAYAQGALWGAVSQVHILTGVIAILMTVVVIVSVLIRPRSKMRTGWTPEGAALVAAYVVASVLVFLLA